MSSLYAKRLSDIKAIRVRSISIFSREEMKMDLQDLQMTLESLTRDDLGVRGDRELLLTYLAMVRVALLVVDDDPFCIAQFGLTPSPDDDAMLASSVSTAKAEMYRRMAAHGHAFAGGPYTALL